MTRKLKDKFKHKPKKDLDWHAGVAVGVVMFIYGFIYSLLVPTDIQNNWGVRILQVGGSVLICIAVPGAVRWYEKRKNV